MSQMATQPADGKMPIRFNAILRWFILSLSAIGLTVSSLFVFRVVQGNFYVVSDGIIYRSGQLSTDTFRHDIQKHKIKSILNLRGRNRKSRWYQEETKLAAALDVTHFDYAISANKEVSDSDIDRILDIIRQAPKPLLIHCKTGSDRTGLVVALYLNQIEGVAAREAYGQLSFLYGHFPYLWDRTDAMDRTFWRYVNTHPH